MNNFESDLKNIIDNINIEVINPNIKFWMVRTKKGNFYDEFIRDKFIALGWNTILDKEIIEYNKNKDSKEEMKRKFEKEYPRNKQITQTVNKCDNFINNINVGDIIMIPSAQNEKITFAIAEEYYEDTSCTYEKEVEVITQIDSGINYGIEFKCPFVKRRRIKILKTVDGEKLNINLYKVLASYHGLSNIDNYGNFILSTIYNSYYWEEKINFVFNIEQEKEISAKQLSSFIYNASQFMASDEEDLISAKANINSPGDLILSIIQNAGTDVVGFLNTYKFYIALVWISICGGKFAGFEVSSILDVINRFRESNSKIENEKLDRELKQIQIEEAREKLDKIKAASDSLKINKDAVNNIINFNDYRGNNDDQ